MIPLLYLDRPTDVERVERILARLMLDPVEVALSRGRLAPALRSVTEIVADVAERGDEAIVAASRKYDDPNFSASQIRVTAEEMRQAAGRVPINQMAAMRRSIAQVREYQRHIMPADPPPLRRPGVELGLRFTPLDSAGLFIPGGKASYPSTLIMLAVPAQVAGVKRLAACCPPSAFGRSDLVLAVCHEIGLTEFYRASGVAAIAAMAFGTASIPRVDKIFGPGNLYIQLAKRLLAGAVGIDAFLGPSEIVVIADETARPEFIAADMIAQAEHDPGACFLLTNSAKLAAAVNERLGAQLKSRGRAAAIERSLREDSAIVVDASMEQLVELANRFAAEHVNIQTRDPQAVLKSLRHGGAVFVGPYSPVAAGDYVAGPSHSLPTNTTARFSSGISVYDFLKRGSVESYEKVGLERDAKAIIDLAEAEGLDAHAASVHIRLQSDIDA